MEGGADSQGACSTGGTAGAVADAEAEECTEEAVSGCAATLTSASRAQLPAAASSSTSAPAACHAPHACAASAAHAPLAVCIWTSTAWRVRRSLMAGLRY